METPHGWLLILIGTLALAPFPAGASSHQSNLPNPPSSPPIPSSRPPHTPPDAPAGGQDGQTEPRLTPVQDIPLPEPRPPAARDVKPPAGAPVDAETSRPPARSVGRPNATNFTRKVSEGLRRTDEACRERLKRMSVAFELQSSVYDAQGCSMPFPLLVSTLGPGIALEPAGVMNCPMAEAAAKFAQSVVAPAAKSAYGAELKSIANASAYVCRPRNGSSKLSEHAFGNAVDMARFVLADGTGIDVAATTGPKAGPFLAELRKAACGPFKTVLGPGSDADHANHFHFDLATRRNGSAFCQ
ncbi:extensin family protein [Arvimicrobium flavum]|uniref:extensin-like domain-containing protein n=1 Tax=Arvimicrobium flavum TaxID=3393320 RepID=UPI00237A6723|nr:extensin family protein [Mesorhizobium shangrilense]